MHRCHRRLAASLAVSLGLLATTPALPALAAEPSAQDTASARAHFKQGRAYQEAGAYDRAIAEYAEANRLAPRPELLFNIAQCHRLAGQTDEAIDYYHRFVEAAPDAAVADEARAYIATLEHERYAREQQTRPAKAPPPLELATPIVRPTPPPAPSAHDTTPAAPSAPDDRFRWLGIGGVVAGVALVGTGTYFGLHAVSEADAIGATTGPWTKELQAREEAGQADQQKMVWMVSGGSVLLVGGAALWWWSGRRVTAVPAVGKDSASLLFSGKF